MLRRKPTALTISPEDLAAFEELHARKVAYKHFRKTGEDPQGLFSGSNAGSNGEEPPRYTYEDYQAQYEARMAQQQGTGRVDPNDELKPLPGDKARIVRSREERIVGGGSGTGMRGNGG